MDDFRTEAYAVATHQALRSNDVMTTRITRIDEGMPRNLNDAEPPVRKTVAHCTPVRLTGVHHSIAIKIETPHSVIIQSYTISAAQERQGFWRLLTLPVGIVLGLALAGAAGNAFSGKPSATLSSRSVTVPIPVAKFVAAPRSSRHAAATGSASSRGDPAAQSATGLEPSSQTRDEEISVDQALERATVTNEAQPWKLKTGAHGLIVAGPLQSLGGRNCRRIANLAVDAGGTQVVRSFVKCGSEIGDAKEIADADGPRIDFVGRPRSGLNQPMGTNVPSADSEPTQ